MSPGPRFVFGLFEEEEDVKEAMLVQVEEAEIAPANSSRLSMTVVMGDVDGSSWDEALEFRLVIFLVDGGWRG